jgi:hypothetical protein
MNPVIEKEYRIPGLGMVRIIHVGEERDYSYNGEYYANVENYGDAGRFGKSVEDTEERMLIEVKNYLTQEKEKLNEKIEIINSGLERIAKKLSENIPQLNVGGKK